MQAVKALYKQGQIQLLEPLNGITEAELFIPKLSYSKNGTSFKDRNTKKKGNKAKL